MARCYHGVVRRDLMTEIRNRTGAFFHGSSPDMSGAVALAFVVDRYVEFDVPLSISGISGNSNSGRSALNKHKGELSSETQTSAFAREGWMPGVPRFFSVETVWAHAGLSTLERLAPERLQSFNYARLLALCGVRHPEFELQLAVAIKEATQICGPDLVAMVEKEKRRVRLERAYYLARRILLPTAANGRKYIAGLETLADASCSYEAYAQVQGFSFELVAAHIVE